MTNLIKKKCPRIQTDHDVMGFEFDGSVQSPLSNQLRQTELELHNQRLQNGEQRRQLAKVQRQLDEKTK